jgi:hypothetical protein
MMADKKGGMVSSVPMIMADKKANTFHIRTEKENGGNQIETLRRFPFPMVSRR